MASEATPRSAPGRALARARPEPLTWMALAVMLVVATAFLLYETRGTTFWVDEWDWVLRRRQWNAHTFLEPHNEHLSLIPVAIYKLLFELFGLRHYGAFRVVVIATHLACTTLLFVYASRRLGGFLALCMAAILLFLGPAWQNIISPFQVTWLISLAAGIGALLALDRADRRGDVVACALLGIALASSGLGLAIAVGVFVELAWGRRNWRELWVVAVPMLPYALWWLVYQNAGFIKGNIDQVPDFAMKSAAGSLSALAGLTGSGVPQGLDALEWGRPLAVVAAIGLIWSLSRYQRVPPRVLGLMAAPVAFWVLTGLRRAMIAPPDSSRYLYVGGLFFLLLGAELARGVRVTRGPTLVVALLVGAVLLSNAGTLRDGGRFLRSQAELARGDLTALEVGRDSVAPNYAPLNFPGVPFIDFRAGPYYDAAAEFGSPAYSAAELASAPEPARLGADAELIRIHDVRLRAASRAPASSGGPESTAVTGGRTTARGGCLDFRPDAAVSADAPPALDVTVPRAGLLVRASGGPAKVDLRRFAGGYSSITPNTVTPGSAATLEIASDRASQPWHARVSPQERVSVCALR